jgi:hypothetical protein
MQPSLDEMFHFYLGTTKNRRVLVEQHFALECSASCVLTSFALHLKSEKGNTPITVRIMNNERNKDYHKNKML